VLLRNKKLLAMNVSAEHGGIASISPWRGEEYKGRISSKTQLFSWKSDSILTADGLPVRFHLGIWWAVTTPGRYVSRIAAEYHDDGTDQRDSLNGAAQVWLEKLAAGTLREQVSRLPSSRIISSKAEAFLEIGKPGNSDELNFAREIGTTTRLLDEKTQGYGIHVERIEIQDLELPTDFQKTIEEMRRAHIEPGMAELESRAFAIRANTKTDVEIRRLTALAGVIGREAVGTKEILKDVDIAGLANPLLAVMPVMQPAADAVKNALTKGLSPARFDGEVRAPSAQLLKPETEPAKAESRSD
jgi:regulator of protease activity HflC (stomatin/prohibitin superfamily)